VEKTALVAQRFRFYAGLYQAISIVFLLLGLALVCLLLLEPATVSNYWIAGSFLAAAYLWGVSGLGYAGVRAYITGSRQSTASLLAFMVMIVAFLSLFVAAISLETHHDAWLGTVPNLLVTTSLFAFGAVSYLIEIVYLTLER